MTRFCLCLIPLSAACTVGGGERSWSFDPADVDGVDIVFGTGDITLLAEVTDQVLVDWEGGGLGRDVIGHAEIVDGILRVGSGCSGTCGGELDLLVPAGVPVRADLDIGDMDLELTERAHLSACLGTGDIDLVVPGGGYLLDLDAGAGAVRTDGVWHDEQADTVLQACIGAGDLRVSGR